MGSRFWGACSIRRLSRCLCRRAMRSRCQTLVTDSNPTANPAERRKRHGLTIVYTGDGKGKTTASIGLVVRAAGNRMRVFFLQFIKGQWKSGEREILRALPGVELEVTGRGFTIDGLRDPRIPMDDHAAAAAIG